MTPYMWDMFFLRLSVVQRRTPSAVRCTAPSSACEPIRARLRQLRVVVQELEQDDDEVVTPRPEPQHCGHEQKQKRKFGQKGRLNVRSTAQKKEETFNYRKISRKRIFLQFYTNSKKKSTPRKITVITDIY